MRFSPATKAIAAALCLLTAGHVAAQQPAPANLERVTVAGRKGEVSPWFRAESQRFVVYSDAREEDVTQLLDNLEKLDHVLRIYTQPADEGGQPEPKLTLYYASRLSALREVDGSGPANAVGLYSSCASGVQGFNVLLERIPSLRDEQLDKSKLDDTLSYVFEAYTRHFLYRHTDIRTPASFIDGFAQYFSSVRFSAQQMVVGRTPPALGQYLHFLSEGRRYGLDYEDVLQNNIANAKSYGGEAGVRLEFEAKSWLLTHYMLSSDENRKRLGHYLAAVERGASPTVAFERVFGLKKGDAGQVMWRYGLSSVKALRVAMPSLPVARVSFRTLPQASGEFLLAESALKSCPSRPAGEALLKQVAALAARFPNDERARLTLSRAQIDWGNPQDAVPALNALVAADEANAEAWTLLGMAGLRLAERSEGDARRAHLQAAVGQLQRARALSPQSPEAALAVFKAEVAATEEPGSAALQGVISAWQASREVDALARSAALAYAYEGNADAAYQALGALAGSAGAGDSPQAQWARQWQGRLSTGVARRDILAEMRRDPVPEMPFKEWTLDKKSAMQAAELAAGLEGAQSFMQQQAESQRTEGAQLPQQPQR
ncbi:hypothetical protein ACG04R_27000 [Roseateles sp. BYS78W]|uniref:Tetratricopeptide repeat protein n=1 Tax=Pelomonas candidula TaxID=3299025 RepID=A0ABW7HK91_9BURK